MSSLPESRPCVYLPDELLSSVYRLRDLLGGAGALLVGRTTSQAIALARGTVLEARALADGVLAEMEQLIAVQHEQERSQLAKHVSIPTVQQ